MSTTIGITPSDDGYADQSLPTTHFGGSSYIIAGIDGNSFSGSGGLCRGFVRALLSTIPAGQVIDNAKLKTSSFYSGGDGSYGDYSIYIQNAATTWSKFTLTWNTQPSVSATISDQVLIPAGQLLGGIDFDITADIAAAYAGSGVVAFRIATDQDVLGGTPTEWSNFSGQAWGTGSPYIEVTYSPASTRRRASVVFTN